MGANNARYNIWNYTTACCFKYKCNCTICPNNLVCEQIKVYRKNEYNIHPAKYAMLMTYAQSKHDYTTGFKKHFLEEDNNNE